MSHLRFKHALQTVAAQEFRAKAIKMEAILWRVKRRKKWQPLNVVPVIVRDENIRADGIVAVRQLLAQHAQAGSAIQDKLRAVGRGQFKARRVPGVEPRTPQKLNVAADLGIAFSKNQLPAGSCEPVRGFTAENGDLGHRKQRPK